MKPIPNHEGYFADKLGGIFSMRPHGGNCGKEPIHKQNKWSTVNGKEKCG